MLSAVCLKIVSGIFACLRISSLKEAFLTTLKAIHAAGVLHGDVRSPNLLIDKFGESSIIDFDQAEKDGSESAQEAELKQLSRILEAKGEY